MKTWPNIEAGKSAPRGVKNNNPGNIILTALTWRGKIPNAQNTDKTFEQFETMELGARAHLKNLIYHIEHGANTLEAAVRVWAVGEPEQNLKEYVKFVSDEVGLAPSYQLIRDKSLLVSIAWAMSKMEQGFKNGVPYVDKSVYESAWNTI